MTIFNNAVNREFRDYAASSVYPFTDASRMCATDGRTIPNHVFLDAICYPDDGINGNVWIYGIRTTPAKAILISFMRGEVPFGDCTLPAGDTVGYIYATSGLVCGTVVGKEDGLTYISGLAAYATLFFNPDGLVLRQDRILPIRRQKAHVSVNGTSLIDQGTQVSLAYRSPRFRVQEDSVYLDTSERATARHSDVLVERIVPAGDGEEETTGEVKPRGVVLAAPRWSNLQVITRDNSLLIHKRGD